MSKPETTNTDRDAHTVDDFVDHFMAENSELFDALEHE